MTAVVVENGKATTYPAVYLWNQTKNTSNLTPAWDEFKNTRRAGERQVMRARGRRFGCERAILHGCAAAIHALSR